MAKSTAQFEDKSGKPYVVGEILTFTGRRVRPTELREEDIDPLDIAHALSMQCRFTGHCHLYYSVADHCVRVSELVAPAHALAGLLHDAAEAYLLDLASPIKALPEMAHFRVLERSILATIERRFGLEPGALSAPEIKDVDRRLLATEARDLMPRDAFNLAQTETYPGPVVPRTQYEARGAWVDRFYALAGASPL